LYFINAFENINDLNKEHIKREPNKNRPKEPKAVPLPVVLTFISHLFP